MSCLTPQGLRGSTLLRNPPGIGLRALNQTPPHRPLIADSFTAPLEARNKSVGRRTQRVPRLPHQRGTDAFVCQPSDPGDFSQLLTVAPLIGVHAAPGRLHLHHESHDRAAQVDFITRLQPGTPRIAMHLEAHPIAHDARPAIGPSGVPAVVEQPVLAGRVVVVDVRMLPRDGPVHLAVLDKRQVVAPAHAPVAIHIHFAPDMQTRLRDRQFRRIGASRSHYQAGRVRGFPTKITTELDRL
jgi:hypothetical protein